MSTLRISNALIATPIGREAAKGVEMGRIHTVADAVIDCSDGVITYVGSAEEAPASKPDTAIDAAGRVVLPGFVDSHTHAVFGGYRPDEFAMRLRGATYMEIMAAGGGIQSTVDATRATSIDELAQKTWRFVNRMVEMGVTTVEMKSGYGLDTATERKQLEVIKALADDPQRKLDIVSTFIGAHAVPREYAGRTDEYVDYIISDMLPQFTGLAENCDVFCERNVFEIEQSRRLLTAARQQGYGLKLHADEIVTLGGAELAAELQALSADHLLHISDEGVRELVRAGVVATLLPLTAFSLKEPFAPARKLIDSGAAVALATDLNPGSCFSGSIPLTFALACIYMHMTVEEAITALTLNGAAALGRADRIGSIEPGKQADFAILEFDNYNMLPYYVGMNCVHTTVSRGKITYKSY